MIIYAVIRTDTDEIVYIGQTIQSLCKRKAKHLSESRKGKGSILGAAIRKHTINVFKFTDIGDCKTQQELCNLEKHLIKTFKPRYNIQEGGKVGFTSWNKGVKEARPLVIENISKAARNRKRTKRGKYSKEAVANIRDAKLRNTEKPFLCHQNGKVYKNKVTAAKDLGIKPGGISVVLLTTTKNKSIKGYTFEYLKGN